MVEYRRPGLIARIAEPLRGAAHRFALASLVVLAFGLMLLGKAETVFVERLRTTVTDVAAPILEVMTEPVGAVNRAVQHVRELAALRAENARLREEVARLRGWHGVALRLQAENAALRDMLNYEGPERRAFVTARVIADGRGPFIKSVLVNAGTRDRVAKGQAAVTPVGLVGRVSEAGERSARVLMITDLNSRIPVVVEGSRARAILAGDNTPRPELVFLPENVRVEPGQRIVTSGHGGVLPPGLAVGRIASVRDGDVRVSPFVDGDRLEYIQIIDYQSAPPPVAARGGAGGEERPPR